MSKPDLAFNFLLSVNWVYCLYFYQEEMMRGKPGYEHLNEPLHILVEAELPVEIVDARLMQAREILEDLLRPMVKLSFASQIFCFFCPLELLHPYLVVFLFDFVIRMNPRISTRNSSCGSWQC